jgi:hypothetical protein
MPTPRYVHFAQLCCSRKAQDEFRHERQNLLFLGELLKDLLFLQFFHAFPIIPSTH